MYGDSPSPIKQIQAGGGHIDHRQLSIYPLAFADVDEGIEMIDVNTCCGCPGKKVVTQRKKWFSGVRIRWFWLRASQKVTQSAYHAHMPRPCRHPLKSEWVEKSGSSIIRIRRQA